MTHHWGFYAADPLLWLGGPALDENVPGDLGRFKYVTIE